MIRLSYSTLELVNTCERLFQLEKLVAGATKEESEHLVFGKAFGAGVQSYLQHQDSDKALYEAWLAYWPIEESDKKDQARCCIALERAFTQLDSLLVEYELVGFQERPAIELGFRLDIDEEYYFVGFIDAVLRSRFTGQYLVMEVKTTGLLLNDLSPLYANSGQALGYSIALDKITGEKLTEYGVLYFVAQLGKSYGDVFIHSMHFDKTLADRLNWFITLGLDVKHLHEMAELGVYPRRGSQCLRFNRACKHFGTCQLTALDRPKVEEPDTNEYAFTFSLDELVQDHLERVVTADVAALPTPITPATTGMYDL